LASRFYLPETEAAPVAPPAPAGADWEHVNSVSRKLLKTADSSTLTTTAYSPDGADDITNKDSHHRQFVSDPLAAQTIGGNFTGQMQGLESHASNNCFLTMKVMVISNDGTTQRAVLLAITREAGAEFTTSLRNTTFDSVALAGYTCVNGDRLLVEVGMGGTPTSGSGTNCHNGSLRFGCNASSGDLPVDDTQAGTTYRPWVEFSGTLLFFNTQTVGGYSESPTGAGPRMASKSAGAYSENPTGVLTTGMVFAKTAGGYSEGPAGTLGKMTSKGAGAYTEGPTGTLSRMVSKSAGNYAEAPTAAVAKMTSKVAGGFSETPTATLVKMTGKVVGAYALGPTAAIAKAISKAAGGYSEAPTADLPKMTSKGTGGFAEGPAATMPLMTSKAAGGYTEGPTADLERLTFKTMGDYAEGPSAALTPVKMGVGALYYQTSGDYLIGPFATLDGRLVPVVPAGDCATAPTGTLNLMYYVGAGDYAQPPVGYLSTRWIGAGLSLQGVGGAAMSPLGTLIARRRLGAGIGGGEGLPPAAPVLLPLSRRRRKVNMIGRI